MIVAGAPDTLALVVLAGGRGRRLGFRKDHLPTARGAWLQRLVDAVRTASPLPVREIWLAGDHVDLPPLHEAPRRVADPLVGGGPLAGLAAGLRAMTASQAWVVPCDGTPVGAGLLTALWERSRGGTFQVVVPESATGVQPLPGLYHRSAGPRALASVRARRLRLMDFLGEVDLRVLPWSELEGRQEPGAPGLRDVDRPGDLSWAERGTPGISPRTET